MQWERFSFSFVVFLCFSLSATHLIHNRLPEDVSAYKKGSSREGKFLEFSYLNPTYETNSKPVKESGILAAEYKRPFIFDGLGRFGNGGVNIVMQGLEGVAGFVGGKLGLMLGGPVGIPLGALLGGLKGAYTGSEIGSQIAKSPFKLFKGLGSLGGQSYGSYTSYSGTDGVKYIIAHP